MGVSTLGFCFCFMLVHWLPTGCAIKGNGDEGGGYGVLKTPPGAPPSNVPTPKGEQTISTRDSRQQNEL